MVNTATAVTFGSLLRRHRRAAGLTQEELAAQAGMSAHGIADLEAGRRHSPRRDTVELLADAFGLTGAERDAFAAAGRRKPPSAARTPDAADAPRLVNRVVETTLIERLLDPSGQSLLFFAGEPGIGKSRLLREAAARAEARGWEVLSGGCHRRSGQEPYAPLLTALERHLSRQTPALQRERLRNCGWLARLLPELAESGALTPPSAPLPPEQERRLMFASVGRYLVNVAGPAGVLLLLDDLQWAATDALDLLAGLARASTEAAAGAPVRILAAYRDTETRKHDALPTLIADLAREELAVRATVTSLSLADAGVLLDQLLPNLASAYGATNTRADATSRIGGHEGLKRQLLMRAGGAPYFLTSCAQAILTGAVTDDGADAATFIPSTVAETIRQRVGALPEAAQKILATAAIIGRVASRALILRVVAGAGQADQSAQSEESVLAALDDACAARLLEEEGERAYRFTHDLVREALVVDLTSAQRVRLHRQVAEALEQEPGALPVERLAYHYAQSEVAEKAARYLEQAGDRARVRYALAEAADYYRQTVGQLDGLGHAQQAALAREKLGAVLVITAQYDEALAAVEAAVVIYRTAKLNERLLAAVAQVGWIHTLRGAPVEGVAYLKPFVESLEHNKPTDQQTSEGDSEHESVSPPGAAALYTSLAHLHYLGGSYSEELSAAEQAVAFAHTTQDAHLRCLANFEYGTALLYQGRFTEALPVLEVTLPLARETGDSWVLCWLLSSASTIYHFRGQWEQDQRYIDQALELAERLGDPSMTTLMVFRQATIAQMRGEWARALELLDRCAEFQQGRVSWITPYPLYLLGELRLTMGRREEGLALLEAARTLAVQTGDRGVERFAHIAIAEWDLLAGRPEAARARMEPMLDTADLQEGNALLMYPLLAWAYLDLGDLEQAEAIIAQATTRWERMGGFISQVDVLRVQAMILMRQQRWDEAMAACEASLRMAHAMPYPYGEAKTHFFCGLLLSEQGQMDEAQRHFAAALTLLHQLGERQYADRVEQVMRES